MKEHVIYYGGDYNPEQWDEKTVEEDMRLFRLAKVNLVVIGVFAWAKMEPEEGRYEFGWLDKLMDTLDKNQIKACLATGTAAQPAWLSKKYPQVLPVDRAGRKRTHGMRMFFCVNSPKYRERARALAEALAMRYRNHPALAMWHVANEYGTFCYCETCQGKFREWLKNRYGTIACLNERWNTAFWGRTFTEFEEIMLPTELNDDYRFQPNIQLDYQRFVTDSTIACFENEYRVLKQVTPDIPVFTNISGFIKNLDQFKMTAHMDLVGWDNYPWPTHSPALAAMKHDIMRGLKNGQPYLLAEQSPNQQNWQPYNKLKRPGEVRRLTYQALAHGAESCLFFQMRQSAAGQEKFHGAVISHAGHENTRVFRECQRLGEELLKAGPAFQGGRILAKVGFLMDWDSWWALEQSSGPSRDIDYLKTLELYYTAFYERNIPVDFVAVDRDLSSCSVIVAPMLYMMKEGAAERITEFVEQGGIFLATTMTGLADENDRCVFGAYPGKLRKLLGIWVEETDALFPDERNEIRLFDGRSYECSLICDVIHTEGAEVLGVYGKDFYQGSPCVTRNSYGKGSAYYVGTQPEAAYLKEFSGMICDEAGLSPFCQAGENMEIMVRQTSEGKVLFAINHGKEESFFILEGEGRNLLAGKTERGRIGVKAGDVVLYMIEQKDTCLTKGEK